MSNPAGNLRNSIFSERSILFPRMGVLKGSRGRVTLARAPYTGLLTGNGLSVCARAHITVLSISFFLLAILMRLYLRLRDTRRPLRTRAHAHARTRVAWPHILRRSQGGSGRRTERMGTNTVLSCSQLITLLRGLLRVSPPAGSCAKKRSRLRYNPLCVRSRTPRRRHLLGAPLDLALDLSTCLFSYCTSPLSPPRGLYRGTVMSQSIIGAET